MLILVIAAYADVNYFVYKDRMKVFEMDGSPLQRPAEPIRDALTERIVMGQYRHGERLDEQSLADEFRVSRTPLREALRMLSASGLVRHEHRRGVFVHYPSLEEVIEMFQVMAEVEAICGRYAARRIDADQLAELNAALNDCEDRADAQDIAGYYAANQRFHEAIYRASGNSFLAVEAARLHQRLRPFRRMQLDVRGRVAQSLAEHRDIFAALEQGDSVRAAQALMAHISVQGERFNDLVANYRRLAGS